jgi:hypothetical protein
MAIMDRIDILPALGFPTRFFGKIIKEYDNGSIEMKVKYPKEFEGDMIFPEEGIKSIISGVYVPANQAFNKIEPEPEFKGDEDKEAYLDYIHNAGPKHADRKKKSGKPKPRRKIVKKCKCK